MQVFRLSLIFLMGKETLLPSQAQLAVSTEIGNVKMIQNDA